MCPACRAPIGLAAYYVQAWVRRITCPSCKATVRVRGMLPFFALLLAPALVLTRALAQAIHLGHPITRPVAGLALLLVAAAALIPVGLATWMRLEREI